MGLVGHLLRALTTCVCVTSVSITHASPNQLEGVTARELIEAPIAGGGYAGKPFAVSPDQRAIAFQLLTADVEANDYKTEWFILDLAQGGVPRFVANGGDVMLNIRQRVVTNGGIYGSAPKWSPDGSWIAFARQDGDEIQIWRASRDGRAEEQLTRNESNVFGSTGHDPLFEWSRNGSKIYYEVARPRSFMKRALAEEGARGFLFDDRFRPYASYKPFWARCGESRVGDAPTASQSCEPVLWTHEIANGVDRLATPDEVSEYDQIKTQFNLYNYNGVTTVKRIAKDGTGRRATLENVDPDEFAGFEPPVRVTVTDTAGNRQTCEHDVCRSSLIEDLWLFGDDIVFQRREGARAADRIGHWAFYRWSPETKGLRQILKTKDYFFDCATANDDLICYHEAPATPRRIVRLNVDTGEMAPLFEPASELARRLNARVEHLEIEDGAGGFTYAKLVYPQGYIEGGRYPLVIVQGHNRGFLEGGSGNEYPVHLFAQEGFFVLNALPYQDFSAYERLRGEALARKEFQTFQLRKNALSAYARFINDLGKRGLIDPDLVGITGLSSGSSNIRYGLIHSDLFATAVMSTGYAGPQQHWFSPSSFRESISGYFGGKLPFEPGAEKFMANEQLGWHARETVFPPLLWQVADSELSHALFDYNLLYDEGQAVEMYVYPDTFHIKHQPVHRYNLYRRNVQWMKFWLQGEEVDDPLDRDQYARWAALCEKYRAAVRDSAEMKDRTPRPAARCAISDADPREVRASEPRSSTGGKQ